MTHPNALSGIKKLYTAQIIILVVSLLGIINVLAITMVLKINPVTFSSATDLKFNDEALALVGALSLLSPAAGILTIVGAVLQLVGLHKAGQDENLFHIAFQISIFMLAAVVLSTLFTPVGENLSEAELAKASLINSILDVVKSLSGIAVRVLCILGLKHLAESLMDAETAAKATTLLRIIPAMMIASYGVGILSSVLNTNSKNVIQLIGIISIGSIVLELVSIFLYLSLLKQSIRMLERN